MESSTFFDEARPNAKAPIKASPAPAESTTSIRVTASGVNAVLSANVRSLNVNNNQKYGNAFNRLEENNEILQNVVSTASTLGASK